MTKGTRDTGMRRPRLTMTWKEEDTRDHENEDF
jgi:hypothetical protein